MLHNIDDILWVVKNILLAVASLAIVFYTLWVFFLSNWRKYPAGRRVLGFVSSLVAVLGYTLVALFDGGTFIAFPPNEPSLWRIILGVAVYGLVAYATIRLDITLVYTWNRGEVTHASHTANPFIPDEKTDSRILRAARGKKK